MYLRRCLTPPSALSGACGFLAANLYAKSVFGEDALVNLSVEQGPDGKLAGYIRIRHVHACDLHDQPPARRHSMLLLCCQAPRAVGFAGCALSGVGDRMCDSGVQMIGKRAPDVACAYAQVEDAGHCAVAWGQAHPEAEGLAGNLHEKGTPDNEIKSVTAQVGNELNCREIVIDR